MRQKMVCTCVWEGTDGGNMPVSAVRQQLPAVGTTYFLGLRVRTFSLKYMCMFSQGSSCALAAYKENNICLLFCLET